MALKPEQIAHINVYNWFCHEFPELADDFHHFANERFLNVKLNPADWQTGRTLKRMGVKKGVPDFFLAYPTKGYHGLWLELKVGKGKLSHEQVEFLQRKMKNGYHGVLAYGEEDAKVAIQIYLQIYTSKSNEMLPKTLYPNSAIC